MKKIILPALLFVLLLSGCSNQENNREEPSVPYAQETAEQGISGSNTIKLSLDGTVYSPQEIRVKKGDAVRIEADLKTLVDSMDTVIIEGYDIKKVIKPGDNIIEFVADTPGEFRMYCANRMGNGKLIVES